MAAEPGRSQDNAASPTEQGVAKLAAARRTVTESRGTLKLANGSDIAKQLTGVADALNAKALDSETRTYNWAFEQQVLAEARAKVREKLQESADAVDSAAAVIVAIQNEGKPKRRSTSSSSCWAPRGVLRISEVESKASSLEIRLRDVPVSDRASESLAEWRLTLSPLFAHVEPSMTRHKVRNGRLSVKLVKTRKWIMEEGRQILAARSSWSVCSTTFWLRCALCPSTAVHRVLTVVSVKGERQGATFTPRRSRTERSTYLP
ncbi:unnamed protein product [Prorocentrum cordatum]|uniref:Uncharacterized protein n=1 Tax=Prorocentrum cordatum TaxID=2364126 RepID=A0ABN9WAX9_9DINO|nr:unnamed protein product [Polarella glacialis]